MYSGIVFSRLQIFTRSWMRTLSTEWRFHGREVSNDRAGSSRSFGALPRIKACTWFRNAIEGRLLHEFVAFLQGRTLGEPLASQAALDWACSRGGPRWQTRR